MDKRYAIVVSSDQIFEDSLPMASLGETTFLDFLLGRIQKACPDQFRIFSMTFRDFQKVREDLIDHIKSFGFEVFMGEPDDTGRMSKAAWSFDLDIIVDINIDSPLISLDFIHEMVGAQLDAQSDVTICHNLPRNLAPIVVGVQALDRYNSMVNEDMRIYLGLEDAVSVKDTYYGFMLANPGHFKPNLFNAPIKWKGAELNPFAADYTTLVLDKQESLSRIRDVVYTIKGDAITADDVIDYMLIKNMRKTWGRGSEFDTKRIVADQKEMTTQEAYKAWTQKELDWFVLKDERFVGGKDLAESNILELGCGHGRLVMSLAPHFKQVCGTDATRERYMEGRYRLRNIPNTRLTNNDGRSLSQYGDDSFDFSFAHGVFVHINSKTIINNYIHEMARVTRKGGRVKFDIYHGKDLFGMTTSNFGVGARYTEEEVKAVLASSGLKCIDIEHVLSRQYFRDAEDGKDYSVLPLEQMLVIAEK